MIYNIKRLLIVISSLSFIFSRNEPVVYHIERENIGIISDNIINSNYKKNSYLSFSDYSDCDLRYSEMVIKYIFNEDGYEKIYQIKYVNMGDSDKCIERANLSGYYNISDIKIEGANNLNYRINSNIAEISFNLKSNNYAILSYKLLNNIDRSKFYRMLSFYIQKGIKYIFRARQPLELAGMKYGKLKEGRQKNGAPYYYHDDDAKSDFEEAIYLSSYGIKFKSDFTVTLSWIFWRRLEYVQVPNMHEFGNNEILSDKVLSNLKENEITIEKDNRYITVKSDKRKTKFTFTFSKEFQSNINNEWALDGNDLINTCTTKTKNKVSEILANSNSQEKDYVILGRWVYNNIKYNLEYSGKKWTVDQILDYKTGVCSHKARLFTAFLNCINIDAVYTTGFAHTSDDNNIDLKSLHAWTVAKIDGKWVAMDATWNIFNGKLPLGFVFRYYSDDNRGYDADWHIFSHESSNKSEMKFNLGSDIQVNLKINALNFISRELEDDNEGDFEVNFDDNISTYIIISLIVVLIIGGTIGTIIHSKKKKRKNKNNNDLNISLSINE